ncbi:MULTISPECIES: BLUF domain-containing protein [unclassified Devosia]|uniref:BLUF domain-containing protein n=1 Tax=unclassified Devosia TaxID=196773 RepID=UPI00086AE02F|nr:MULTISPECIES: BLUF domain-containing protein [unclassified Devosia]MBN9360848.1 BLUF domain-containing protein [Devosia sp.]ODS88172.1 MAG: blue light sensor protein [Devosia sp. SCN 66-27]OJX22801.1 MAG: blue light sensor protein [Devosia sp. 66-14]
MLVRCLYASRATQSPMSKLTDSILKTSRDNNPARGITGFLCFSGDIFIQVLEGGRNEVCELFNRIVKDERHTNVRLLAYQEIRQRKFGTWTMGQVDLSKVNMGLLLKYHEKADFDPFTCSGEATLALLDELVATASIVGRSQ